MNNDEEHLRKQIDSLLERVEKLESQLNARPQLMVQPRRHCRGDDDSHFKHSVLDAFIDHHQYIYCKERHGRSGYFCRFCGKCTLCLEYNGLLRRGYIDPKDPTKPCHECSKKEMELCICNCPVHDKGSVY